ncbi:MAG TPA: hypothetical protein VE820_09625 [Sphingomicrobium sp.]|nr:hypothetical protein [Sphingomicrobium sp.]
MVRHEAVELRLELLVGGEDADIELPPLAKECEDQLRLTLRYSGIAAQQVGDLLASQSRCVVECMGVHHVAPCKGSSGGGA